MIKKELRMSSLAINPTPFIFQDYDDSDGNSFKAEIDADKIQWTTTAHYVYSTELQTIIKQNIMLFF